MYPWGMCSGSSATYRSHPYELQRPALALAEEKPDTIYYGGGWVAPALDEGLRPFIQAWRAIPDLDYAKVESPTRATDPVVAWQARDRRNLVFYLVNKTDRTQSVKITFTDSPSGVRNLVTGDTVGIGSQIEVAVPPFMLGVMSAARVNAIRRLEATAKFD
jgi:hypothetical protein